MYAQILLGLAIVLAPATAARAQSAAHPLASDSTCLKQLRRDEADLPPATRLARAALIANPARIDLIAAEAAEAGAQKRAEIELGILRAADWLRCIDPFGYKALENYLRTHASDPVVADLDKALNAEASVNEPATGGGSASSSAGGSAAGAPFATFAAGAPVISPSH